MRFQPPETAAAPAGAQRTDTHMNPHPTNQPHRPRALRAGLAALFALGLALAPRAGASETSEVATILRQRDAGTAAAAIEGPSAAQAAAALLRAPLTADAAVRVALLQHGGVRAAVADSGAARALLLQASQPKNIEVEVSLRAPSDPGQPLQADLGVDYELSSLILLPLRRSAAQSELGVARVQAAAEVLRVAYQARLAFYEAAARAGMLAVRRQALAVADASYAARAELFRAGNVPAAELHQERAALETARLQENDAERADREARERLSAALGLSGELPAPVLAPDALTAPAALELPDAEARAVAASLDLAALRGGVALAHGRARLARASALVPDLKAGFHGERDGTSWELGGHFSLSLPLINQGQGAVLVQKSRASALQARTQAAEARLRALLRTAAARLSLGLARVRIVREGVLPARTEALRALQLQYNAMQISVFQLLEARRAQVDAELAQIGALEAAQKARAELDALLAGLSPGALTAQPAEAPETAGLDATADTH